MRPWIGAMLMALASIGAQEKPLREDYPKTGVYWESKYSDGTSDADLRQVPMMWVFMKDGVPACASLAEAFLDKKYIESSRLWVNVIAHPGKTHEVDVEIGGKRTTLCSLYWGITCTSHSIMDGGIRARFKEPPGLRIPDEIPAILLLDSKGRELARLTGSISARELAKTQAALFAKATGEKVPADDWRAAKALRDEAKGFLDNYEWPKAIEAYARLTKSKYFPIRYLGDNGLKIISGYADQLYADAQELCSDVKNTKKLEHGKAVLQDLVRDFKPMEASKKAEKLLATLKSRGY